MGAPARREQDAARDDAREVTQVAGSRGFRLLGLEARSLLAQLPDSDEPQTHRDIEQTDIEEFVTGLPADFPPGRMGTPKEW